MVLLLLKVKQWRLTKEARNERVTGIARFHRCQLSLIERWTDPHILNSDLYYCCDWVLYYRGIIWYSIAVYEVCPTLVYIVSYHSRPTIWGPTRVRPWAPATCCIHLFHMQRCTAVQCWPPPICRRHSHATLHYLQLISIQGFPTFKTVSQRCNLWFSQNGLVINPDKSEAVLSIKQVDVASCPVLVYNAVKILLLTLEQHLTFNDYVQNVRKSAQYRTRALRHIRSSLTADMVKTVVSTLVNSPFDCINAIFIAHQSII